MFFWTASNRSWLMKRQSSREAVSASKRAKLVRTAEAWLAQVPTVPREACFLVALVGHDGAGFSLHVIDDAFDGS